MVNIPGSAVTKHIFVTGGVVSSLGKGLTDVKPAQGFSADEIAAMMATSRASVHSALQRARRIVAERVPPVSQTQTLRDHGIGASRNPVTEQAVRVLVRQLGTWLLQPALGRLWDLSGAEGPPPEVRITLR